MRVSRSLRERVKAKSLDRRVDEISQSLTKNWKSTVELRNITVTGFREADNILQDHQRKIDVLNHMAGSA